MDTNRISDAMGTVQEQEAALKELTKPKDLSRPKATIGPVDESAEIDNLIVQSKLTYADLSKLKQRRILKRVNKALKRSDARLMTHADMLKQLEWEGLEGVYGDITTSILTTLNGLGKVLENDLIPKKVVDSDMWNALYAKYHDMGSTMQAEVLEIKAKHYNDEDGFKKGIVVDTDEQDIFVECTAAYIDVRTRLISDMGSLEDPLNALLSIIKLEKLRKLAEEAGDVEPDLDALDGETKSADMG